MFLLELVLALWVERIPQPVTKEVHGEEEDGHGDCGEDKLPRIQGHAVNGITYQGPP